MNESGIVNNLLRQRQIVTNEARRKFLQPPEPSELIKESKESFGLEEGALDSAANAVKSAVLEKRPIFIHGDYDVDGVCAASILWQTIYRDLSCKNCLPFIPNRFEHGYGLSKSSIDSLSDLGDLGNLSHSKPLLITVDCGITALDEVAYAQSRGFEVLILDHHTPAETLPDCSLLWTDKLCAAGLSWVLVSRLVNQIKYLDLLALATVADLQPLLGANRSLVKFGLAEINHTQNLGLKELIRAAGIEGRKIGTFEVGWILAPRINASGRLETALESLRLLCTNKPEQARQIAQNLNRINAERQELTASLFDLARSQISNDKEQVSGITVAVHEEFHEGIIGLVAGKLVQEYGAPSVVVSRGAEFSKASARSIDGFNVVEFLRSLGGHYENIGGHAGAAGFTIRTDRLEEFTKAARQKIREIALPKPKLVVDLALEFGELNLDLYNKVQKLEPFGLGNPEPVFLLKNALVVEVRTVGKEGRHLKMKVKTKNQESRIKGDGEVDTIDCIGFDLGEWSARLAVGDSASLVFYLSADSFSSRPKLLLKLKDLRKSA